MRASLESAPGFLASPSWADPKHRKQLIQAEPSPPKKKKSKLSLHHPPRRSKTKWGVGPPPRSERTNLPKIGFLSGRRGWEGVGWGWKLQEGGEEEEEEHEARVQRERQVVVVGVRSKSQLWGRVKKRGEGRGSLGAHPLSSPACHLLF